MSEPTTAAAPRRSGAVRKLLTGVAFAATFVAGGVLLSGPSAFAMQMAMEHMGGGHGGMGGMHAAMHAHLEHMLGVVGATPEQKARIHAIFKDAMAQIKPLEPGLGSIHRDLHAILTAPTIDRGALEQLRAARIADVDQESRIIAKAVADAAEVLTPEQRAKFAAAMAQHGAHH